MTSYRQIEANRRNALKSTGPRTEAGKHISRCNAVRHGLTAETVIGALEDAEDYKAFEGVINCRLRCPIGCGTGVGAAIGQFAWRLRRATTIETGLFEIQAVHLKDFRKARQISTAPHEIVYALFNASSERQPASHGLANETENAPLPVVRSAPFPLDRPVQMPQCCVHYCQLNR